MELTGSYGQFMNKLHASTRRTGMVETMADDMDRLLKTVVAVDGGTKSVIADALPEEMATTYNADAVVEVLKVLQRYDLVELEGNTWNPGPALGE